MKNSFSCLCRLTVAFSLFPFYSCQENVNATQVAEGSQLAESNVSFPPGFLNYWYSGKAEISSYQLTQARYRELHPGSAVLVFVTEDFSQSKQVKLDNPLDAAEDKLPVLKLNASKKFNTGIYPYSMMLSVFSPMDGRRAVKTTASIQEWCGMTFQQLNLRQHRYEIESHSYFEAEGDQALSVESTLLEDELWNLIRLAPENLPTGSQKILPGAFFTRLSHRPLQTQTANLRLEKRQDKNLYFIDYPSLNYTLLIIFESAFPYKILGWEETFPGFDGKKLTTTAVLDKTIQLDYWNRHSNTDRALREQLNLPTDFQ
jgi:hypothetical protein